MQNDKTNVGFKSVKRVITQDVSKEFQPVPRASQRPEKLSTKLLEKLVFHSQAQTNPDFIFQLHLYHLTEANNFC